MTKYETNMGFLCVNGEHIRPSISVSSPPRNEEYNPQWKGDNVLVTDASGEYRSYFIKKGKKEHQLLQDKLREAELQKFWQYQLRAEQEHGQEVAERKRKKDKLYDESELVSDKHDELTLKEKIWKFIKSLFYYF